MIGLRFRHASTILYFILRWQVTGTGELLRDIMRHWSSGVSVVSASHQGQRQGMTVSSFTSLSLSPPLILIALARGKQTEVLAMQSGCLGVSILEADQQSLAARFADPASEGLDRFAGLETFTLATGSLLLTGCFAWLDCRIEETYQAGTHRLILARLADGGSQSAGRPLIYFDQSYGSFSAGGEPTSPKRYKGPDR